MFQGKMKKAGLFLSIFICLVLVLSPAPAAEKKVLTFQDVMRFREIHNPVISEDGAWIAYNAQPDRGNGEVKIHSLKSDVIYSVGQGEKPVISKDSRWVCMFIRPKAVELEKKAGKKPKQGMAVVETLTGEVTFFEKVEKFSFSDDSVWLAYHHFREEEKEKKGLKKKEAKAGEKNREKKKEQIGATLVLRRLATGEEVEIPYVLSFAFNSTCDCLAYVVSEPEGQENGLYYVSLKEEGIPRKAVEKKKGGKFSALKWTKDGRKLAYIADSSLRIWDQKLRKASVAVSKSDLPGGWTIPQKNEITWSDNGKRLFFGTKPEEPSREESEEKEEEIKEEDFFNVDKILERREVDVWHWNDPFIIPHQKKLWPRLKEQTYLAVFHSDSNRFVQLADDEMPLVKPPQNPDYALGLSDVPYRKEVTWDGRYYDAYVVDIRDGERVQFARRISSQPSLSPRGKYVAFYQDGNWHIFDTVKRRLVNLTHKLGVPFFNEDHDYPRKPPGYGIAGWVEGDSALLVYDKYDIWKFNTRTGRPENITAGKGRESGRTFRVLRVKPEQKFFKKDETLLLLSYHNQEKYYGFYEINLASSEMTKLLEGKKRFRFLAKAKKADVLIYTRESFEEFPDIWISSRKFISPRKISDVNPQIKDFLWGKAELVEWRSVDGIPLQGVLIKPENYEPGRRYPVIVYFYRFFSQRLYEYSQTVVNHRPCLPLYASNGYCIFLPDIRFEVGRPGFSATKCLVPGVQKLIDIGVADPGAIGLHGHSWSGYQTAFVITQTDIFSAAVAGAPVSNMTSAYNGIRWGSGLARQFQYEKTQSRIGGSLWEYPERYIENSPVFFADLIQTPLLIMFGDEDGAVPWYQGIELYLSMRRLGKNCIFLQYRGEPHHLTKYANKLDYAIRMKEFFDHYLKGMPAPEWIKNGVPYRGK